MIRFRNLIAVVCLVVTCWGLVGCSKTSEDSRVEKLKDIEFTVVEESDIPEELMTVINQKKEEPFKLTYYDKEKLDYLYIVVGYGEQPSGGYSVTVDELYLTSNAIYIDTNLLGPGRDDLVTQAVTYPYIVVKIEYMEKPVTFI